MSESEDGVKKEFCVLRALTEGCATLICELDDGANEEE